MHLSQRSVGVLLNHSLNIATARGAFFGPAALVACCSNSQRLHPKRGAARIVWTSAQCAQIRPFFSWKNPTERQTSQPQQHRPQQDQSRKQGGQEFQQHQSQKANNNNKRGSHQWLWNFLKKGRLTSTPMQTATATADDAAQQPKRPSKIVVFGGGSFGTALSYVLSKNGHQIVMLTRNQEESKTINEEHRNPKCLSDFVLPPNISSTTDPEEALKDVEFIVHAIPVQASPEYLAKLASLIPPHVPLISSSKVFIQPRPFFTQAQRKTR